MLVYQYFIYLYRTRGLLFTLALASGGLNFGPAAVNGQLLDIEVPRIITQPRSQQVAVGDSAELRVDAEGTVPLLYQWYKGESGDTSAPVAGATAAVFETPSIHGHSPFWVRVLSADLGLGTDSVTAHVTPIPTGYTAWAERELGEEAARAHFADPDGDNQPNLLEYGTGTDPQSGDRSATHADVQDLHLGLRFDRKADPMLVYKVEGSSDLGAWEQIWSSSGLENVAGEVLVKDVRRLSAFNARYMRLKVGVAEAWGRPFLQRWRENVNALRSGGSDDPLVAAIFGDSWAQVNSIPNSMQDTVRGIYGDAGPGWVAMGNNASMTPSGVRMSFSGVWALSDQVQGEVLGVDGHGLTATAPAARYVVSETPFNEATIHFRKGQEGTFRYGTNKTAWRYVTTAAADRRSLGTVTLSGISDIDNTLKIEWVSGTVTLLGVDLRRAAEGAVVHQCGNGGSSASRAIKQEEEAFKAGLRELDPDVVMIVLGTNDRTLRVPLDEFEADLSTLVGRIRSAEPNTGIIIIAPARNGSTVGTYETTDYRDRMRQVAVAEACAFIDLCALFEDYKSENARGSFQDAFHLSDKGAQRLTDELVSRFLGEE